MADDARYRFGPLEKRGLLLGLTPLQLATLIVAAMAGMMILRIDTDVITVTATAVVVALATFAVFARTEGRPIIEMLPIGFRWMWRRMMGKSHWVSASPLTGRTRIANEEINLPPALKTISILAAPVSGGEIGIIKDAAQKTYTSVISVRGRSFALLDSQAKSRLLEQWADVLAGLAREGSAIKRVQWLERTVPEPGDAIGQYLREAVALPHTSTAVRSYLQLVEDAGPTTQHHESFVAIQFDATRAQRIIKQAGGGDDGACAALARETYGLASRLGAADLDVVGMLTPRLVAQTIRVSFDPRAQASIAMANVDSPDRGIHPDQAWPLATQDDWTYYRSDSGVHATYWVAEWPRLEVGPDFLAPLILQTWVQRTVSVTIEPVPPLRAQREAESARTTDIADSEMRERHGFVLTARRRSEQSALAGREQELASGHADMRFSGYITVSATNIDDLEIACGEVEQQAGQARLVLRRLSGLQEEAFTFTLPLGRGLK
jgi:Putative type VII ESX secretion system translocon, EccE